MSLRTRIEALENGWDKEADDILQEMSIQYDHIRINTVVFSCSTDYIEVDASIKGKSMDNPGKLRWNHTDQCSKMEAFKDALLWLLDKSGLERHKKGDKITIESEGKTYKVKILEECNE